MEENKMAEDQEEEQEDKEEKKGKAHGDPTVILG